MKYPFLLAASFVVAFASCKKSDNNSVTPTPINGFKLGDTTYAVDTFITDSVYRSISVYASYAGASTHIRLHFEQGLPKMTTKILLGYSTLRFAIFGTEGRLNRRTYFKEDTTTAEASIVASNGKIAINIPEVWVYGYQYDSLGRSIMTDSTRFSCNLQEP